jgi:hypothetical protein
VGEEEGLVVGVSDTQVSHIIGHSSVTFFPNTTLPQLDLSRSSQNGASGLS